MSKKKRLIPNQKKGANLGRIEVSSTQISSGPLPSPEMLYRYNQIDPSFAERIFKMAEKEQAKDIKIDMRKIAVGFWLTSTGLICGLMTVAGMLYIAYLSVVNGLESPIKWIFGSMAGIAGLFIYNRKNKS